MKKFLVLEDDPIILMAIERRPLTDHADFVYAHEELETRLAAYNGYQHIFLDDKVPIGEELRSCFPESYRLARERCPNATIYCTSASPGKDVQRFLREHDVELVQKSQIRNYINEIVNC